MNVAQQVRLIAGTPLQLGAKVYVCPPLNLKHMKMFAQEINILQKGMAEVAGETEKDKLDIYCKALVVVTTAALLRNYPEVNEDIVEEGVDTNNMRAVVLAVLGASGFRTVTQEEAEKAVYTQGESTGTA